MFGWITEIAAAEEMDVGRGESDIAVGATVASEHLSDRYRDVK